jgi:hypothetical protein
VVFKEYWNILECFTLLPNLVSLPQKIKELLKKLDWLIKKDYLNFKLKLGKIMPDHEPMTTGQIPPFPYLSYLRHLSFHPFPSYFIIKINFIVPSHHIEDTTNNFNSLIKDIIIADNKNQLNYYFLKDHLDIVAFTFDIDYHFMPVK